MNKIFKCTNRKEIHKKCLYASIAHAVMVGKYPLLSDEIAWDGTNFLSQDMEGTRVVFVFSNQGFLCGIQNENDYLEGTSEIIEHMLDTSDEELVSLCKEEILPYFLVDEGDNPIPEMTAMFWESDDSILAVIDEPLLMKKTNNVLLPYLYTFDDLKKYWKSYYEANAEQMETINNLYEKRIRAEKVVLDSDTTKRLIEWYEDKFELCRQAFHEIGID